MPVSADGMGPEGTRIVLHIENGTVRQNQPSAKLEKLPDFDPDNPLVVGDGDGMNRVLPIDAHKAKGTVMPTAAFSTSGSCCSWCGLTAVHHHRCARFHRHRCGARVGAGR